MGFSGGLVFDFVGVVFDDGVGEDFFGDSFDFGFGGFGGEAVGEGELKVFALTDAFWMV